MLFLSMGRLAAEESILISQSNAAPPPESVEARIKLRQHREASALNRFTFSGNIFDNVGDVVEHWFVMFCPGWHEKCQRLLPSYELLGVQWEDKLNTALMSSKVRFAKVDCATEKALCVSLGIDDYPSVVHYRQQQQVNAWFGGAPGLVRWVKDELQPPKRRKSLKAQPGVSSQSKMEQALEKAADEAGKRAAEQNTCVAESSATSSKERGWPHHLGAVPFLLMITLATYYGLSKYRSVRRRRSELSATCEDVGNMSKNGFEAQADCVVSPVQSIVL
jgi:hypothetical protein